MSVIFLICHNKMSQNLESLYNSMNDYFPNDQCMMLLSHVGVKVPLKVQRRLMNFSVSEHASLIDMVLCSILQLTFKKLLLFKLRYSVKIIQKKMSKHFSFPNYISI